MTDLTGSSSNRRLSQNGALSCKGLRPRSQKACIKCHARKVRCDTIGDGTPCTNCAAFGFECILHIPKKKRPRTKRANSRPAVPTSSKEPPLGLHTPGSGLNLQDVEVEGEVGTQEQPEVGPTLSKELDPWGNHGELAGWWYSLQSNGVGHRDQHHPLLAKKQTVPSVPSTHPDISPADMAILHQQGAFLLPSQRLRNHLVDSFFTWTAPVLPVVDKSHFMQQYKDPAKAPSLLLLQAILLAGASMSSDPELCDTDDSKTATTIIYYKRAKALYDAGYEQDRVVVIQALVIMGWYTATPRGMANAHPIYGTCLICS